MGLIDFILFPIYVALFYMLFARQRRKLKNPKLAFYHKYAFWAKVLGSFSITIFYYYITRGDSTSLYFTEGVHLFNHILNDSDNLQWLFKPGTEYPVLLLKNSWNSGYFGSEANVVIIKLVAVFSFLSFGKYMIINLFFSMLAFTGIWKLFRFFYEYEPGLHRSFAIAILFLPTVVFWSSGALKDPVCMAMLGWLTWSCNEMFFHKKNILVNSIVIVVSALMLHSVKSYILFSYLPFLMFYIVSQNLKLVKNFFLKTMSFVLIALCALVAFLLMADKLQEEMGLLALDKLTQSVEVQQNNFENMADRAGSSFSLGVEYDGSVGGLARIAPAAINATLFRPYLWESRNISTVLSSLESLSLMIFFIYVLFKRGVRHFVVSIVKDPMILYCLAFSLMFSLFVGATTLNFGTLVRYKIPCIPFFVIALVLILYRRMPAARTAGKPSKIVVGQKTAEPTAL